MNRDKNRADAINLRDYVDRRFADQEAAVHSALAAADKAADKMSAVTEHRLAGMNEFREALSDQTRMLVPRLELDAHLNRVHDEISGQATAGTERMKLLEKQIAELRAETVLFLTREQFEDYDRRSIADRKAAARNLLGVWVAGLVAVIGWIITLVLYHH